MQRLLEVKTHHYVEVFFYNRGDPGSDMWEIESREIVGLDLKDKTSHFVVLDKLEMLVELDDGTQATAWTDCLNVSQVHYVMGFYSHDDTRHGVEVNIKDPSNPGSNAADRWVVTGFVGSDPPVAAAG